jgi:hypothetical protein
MYGMINQAIRDLVLEHHGEDGWARVRARCRLPSDRFPILGALDDQVTYTMITAASLMFDVDEGEMYRRVGAWWVHWAAANGYAALLDAYGSDVGALLDAMDRFHDSLVPHMPHATPPRLGVERTPSGFRLRYHSERADLLPFLVGIIEGLGARHGTQYDIVVTDSPSCLSATLKVTPHAHV